MNPVDLTITIIVGLSGFIGLLRGAVREIFGLAALLLGFLVALHRYEAAAATLHPWIENPRVAQAAAFFGIFLLVWLVFAILGTLLRRLLRLLALSWLDRLGGLVFGLARGALVVSLLAWSFTAFGIQPRRLMEAKSSLLILEAGDRMVELFPEGFATRFADGLREARSHWGTGSGNGSGE
jgi:membrane protein required for colicin V production